jgi:putative hydrolase of the HAD superfamily
LLISSLLFDFGGVLYDIDYAATERAFRALGIAHFEEKFSKQKQSQLFDLLETGKIEPDAFLERMQTLCPSGTSKKQVLNAWNAMLIGIPDEKLRLIESLQGRYHLFLLSNTNRIHAQFFEAQIEKQYGLALFKSLFEKVYYSHEIGQRKPHSSVFEWVVDQNGLQADETLFIDDSPQHLEGAKQAGLQVLQVQTNKPYEVELQALLT